jgi:cystathionine beta-lyase/cystathionine gamma-synthase
MPARLARTQANGPNSVIDFDVPEQVVRLNIGLEGPEALWRDLLQAIESSKREENDAEKVADRHGA